MTVYYLPSCKYRELHTLSSQRIQAYLRGKPDHVIADCCKKSQSLFHAGDTVLTNCSSCAIITDEMSPRAEEMSICLGMNHFRGRITMGKRSPYRTVIGQRINLPCRRRCGNA